MDVDNTLYFVRKNSKKTVNHVFVLLPDLSHLRLTFTIYFQFLYDMMQEFENEKMKLSSWEQSIARFDSIDTL